jgi:hypothetical protein
MHALKLPAEGSSLSTKKAETEVSAYKMVGVDGLEPPTLSV